MPNSGIWTANTVTNIATHPLLIAICASGRRGSGDQLRLTPTGPRPLTDADYRPDGSPKAVENPTDLVIRSPATFEPILTVERRERIVGVLEERGRHLKGKPRTRGDRPNYLGGRIFDMNCGWLMYRHERRGRWGYQCSLYQNSQAACCSHNVVDGEATARLVLSSLRQRVLAPTALVKVQSRLEQLAAAEAKVDSESSRRESCQRELATVNRKLATAGRNLAMAETPEAHRAIASMFNELQVESTRLQQALAELAPARAKVDPAVEVEAALAGLGRLQELANPASSDAATATELIREINARLYLRFRTESRGNQTNSSLSCGVLTFGSTPPPGPLYDGPTDRKILRKRLETGESVVATPRDVPPGVSGTGPEVDWSANVQRGTSRCSGPGRSGVMVVQRLS